MEIWSNANSQENGKEAFFQERLKTRVEASLPSAAAKVLRPSKEAKAVLGRGPHSICPAAPA